MRSQHRPFFSVIASDRDREDYLSRLFQACFANSQSFREIALDTIWKVCALPAPIPKSYDWECDYHPLTPFPGGGYPDLCLRAGKSDDVPACKTIFLESKVGSQLKEPQLQRYKEYHAQVLIAITKNRPEISSKRLRQIGVKCLRWQDLCRALRQRGVRGQKDRFLCESFAEYLEESRMAYHEDITKQHLNEMRSVFLKLSSFGAREFVPHEAFRYMDSCVKLLRDVKDSLLEQRSGLAQWTCWGPGYWHEVSEPSKEIVLHALGLSFTPKWRQNNPVFSGRFYFCAKAPVKWSVAYFPTNKDRVESKHDIASISSQGKIDPDKLVRTLKEAAQKWHVPSGRVFSLTPPE